jgi:hypothetical protein
MLEFVLRHIVVILAACVPLLWITTMILERWYPNINKVKLSKLEVAAYIEDFLNGKGGKWDWDDFTSVSIVDPYLDSIRAHCDKLPSDYPIREKGKYCSSEGIKILEKYLIELKK